MAEASFERRHMLHRRARDPRALPAPPARARRRRGPDRPRRAGAADDAVRQAPRRRGPGLPPGLFHILTFPDTLIGAWIALDRADEENGCVWITPGSQHEPVYPDADATKGHGGDAHLADIVAVSGADDPDERVNDLAAVAAKYAGREVPAVLEPGDAVFFGGHVLHRSHANRSATRSRRAFVAHYCNARSYVPWDDEPLADGELGNARHILARGESHLPYAQPRFTAARTTA